MLMYIILNTILIYTILISGKYFSGYAAYFEPKSKPLLAKIFFVGIMLCSIVAYKFKIIPVYIPVICIIGIITSTLVWKYISYYTD